MRPPRFLIGAALLFWGWHGGLLPAALPMALAIEGARGLPWRWELEAQDFYRVADLCTLLLVGIIGYQFIGGRFPEAMFLVLKWLPFAVFPLILAQSYSTQGEIPVEALFLTLRNPRRVQAEPLAPVNVGFPFAAVCALAAAAANPRTPWFYAGLTLLAAWGLWSVRPARQSAALWGLLFLAAAGSGYLGHVGLSRLQTAIEEAVIGWLFDYDLETDPFKSRTRIGAIGKLKLSDRVNLRVRAPEGSEPPRLLRETTYNTFGGGSWFAKNARFEQLAPGADNKTWNLAPTADQDKSVAIGTHLKNGKGVIALPAGTTRILSLPAIALERSNAGAVRVEDAPGFVTYRAQYGGGAVADAVPDPADLQVPATVDETLDPIARRLGLATKSPGERLAAVQAFFHEGFGYTLQLEDEPGGTRSLEEFLVNSRKGHCEYFATATVLLLRKAGIPARYAVGYAVQEYSPLQGQYLVRTRHAHSWALAFVDGAWREVDTTPSVWAVEEEKQASVWQPLLDLGSYAWYLFSRWRWAEEEEGQGFNIAWLAVPLSAVLLWRVFSRRKMRGAGSGPASERTAGVAPESAFYQVVARLEQYGYVRGAGEPLARWLARIREAPAIAADPGEMKEMLGLHYRLRFDPQAAPAGVRARLEALALAWLARIKASSGDVA
ncbi:MAG: transglutaminase domain-containing protein [Betaproteobacteria bacterium]|nr:transglutaminase domain-containing protein [Betaproteobacteria bacterium]